MHQLKHLSFRQQFALFLVSFALLLAGVAVSAWTGPTATPPDGNVSAPLNVGASSQIKTGGLWAASMGTDSGYCIGGSCITSWPTGLWGQNSSSAYFTTGNVGIGTTNPLQQLHISRNSGGDATRLRLTETASGYTWDVGVFGNNSYPGTFGIADMTAGQWRLSINTSGFVGIGTLNPTGLLQVGSDPPVSSRLGPIGGGYITVADNPYGYSIIAGRILATTYFNSDSYWLAGSCWNAYGGCPSDVRLKDHIRPFQPGLDAVLNINPIYYRFNGLGGTPKSDHDLLGVLAQDVEIGAPELITTESVKLHADDADGTDIKKLDNSGLQYLLINAVKELHAKLEAQQAEIDALKKELETLKNK